MCLCPVNTDSYTDSHSGVSFWGNACICLKRTHMKSHKHKHRHPLHWYHSPTWLTHAYIHTHVAVRPLTADAEAEAAEFVTQGVGALQLSWSSPSSSSFFSPLLPGRHPLHHLHHSLHFVHLRWPGFTCQLQMWSLYLDLFLFPFTCPSFSSFSWLASHSSFFNSVFIYLLGNPDNFTCTCFLSVSSFVFSALWLSCFSQVPPLPSLPSIFFLSSVWSLHLYLQFPSLFPV